MHCVRGKLLLHYKPQRNAAKLRESCLAEVMVSYIFRGLLCKTFPVGCITFEQNKKRMFVSRPSEHIRRLSALCFAWISYKYRAYCCNHGQEKKWSELQTGHTISNAITICKREKGRRKGSLLTRERKFGPLGIIRWEYKGGPNLQSSSSLPSCHPLVTGAFHVCKGCMYSEFFSF